MLEYILLGSLTGRTSLATYRAYQDLPSGSFGANGEGYIVVEYPRQ